MVRMSLIDEEEVLQALDELEEDRLSMGESLLVDSEMGVIKIRTVLSPKERIDILSYCGKELVSAKTFGIGSSAKFDSFSWDYTGRVLEARPTSFTIEVDKSLAPNSLTISSVGKIRGISKSGISIDIGGGTPKKLSLSTFAKKNWNF
jgi:hypothetical protein